MPQTRTPFAAQYLLQSSPAPGMKNHASQTPRHKGPGHFFVAEAKRFGGVWITGVGRGNHVHAGGPLTNLQRARATYISSSATGSRQVHPHHNCLPATAFVRFLPSPPSSHHPSKVAPNTSRPERAREDVGDVDAAGVGRGGCRQGRRGHAGAGRRAGGLARRVGIPHRAAARAAGVRHRGRPAGDGAADQAARRAAPGILRERRPQGQGALQGRLLARLHRIPRRQRPSIPGIYLLLAYFFSHRLPVTLTTVDHIIK
jgi:hypothetical protein